MTQVDLTKYGFPPPTQQTVQPAPQPSSGGGFLHLLKNIVSSVAQPITSTVGTGVRAIESIPSLVKGDQRTAGEIQKRPIFGQKTFPGMNTKELLGSAAKTASFLAPELGVSPVVEGAAGGATFGAGDAAEQNQSGKQIVESGVVGGVAGAAGAKILQKVGQLASRVFSKSSTILDEAGRPLTTEAKTALDAIDTKLSKGGQAEAAAQGRAKISGAGAKIEYQPDPADVRLAKHLEPLVKDGTVVAPRAPEDYLNNITSVQKALDDSTTRLRAALQDAKGTWKTNDLIREVANANIPLSIRSTDNVVTGLQSTVFRLADEAPKTPEGLLDLRQDFDVVIRREFPNLYDRENTPVRQYVRSLRESLNTFAERQLPEGKLPSGVKYTDELRHQSALISAKEAMGQKIADELPANSTTISRWAKANPEKARLLRRIVIGTAATGLGVYTLGREINKSITGQ